MVEQQYSMNKTAKILSCVDNVKYGSIHKVVNCSPQLVYNVLKRRIDNYEPRHKKKIKIDESVYKRKFEINELISIVNDNRLWKIVFIGHEILKIKSGFDSKTISKSKVE